jgi:hypothetical protein
VFFVVGLYRLFSVTSRMNHMCPRYVGMVRRFLVMSGLVVLGCFPMMTGSVGKMFLHLPVVLGSFFRHCCSLPARVCLPPTAANAAISVMRLKNYCAG